VLGPTLADIAREKAGILKPGCPAVIGQLPPEAKAVVEQRIKELGCPAVWVKPAVELPPLAPPYQGGEQEDLASPYQRGEQEDLDIPYQGGEQEENLALIKGKSQNSWAVYEGIKYPLPLLGEIQLSNSAIAIATLQILRSQGWQISEEAIASGMAKTTWHGRLQWTTWKNHRLLIDGAHNPAAAIALRQYVDSLNTSVTWVMGILSTKDHADIFNALLRSGDRLYLVPVPDHSSADPDILATLAQNLCPELADCRTYLNLEEGLQAATSNTSDTSERLIVLCGSLYLVGHFLKQNSSTLHQAGEV
jgi:dihydrofolate synthase/folylpolyglutamate synthase